METPQIADTFFELLERSRLLSSAAVQSAIQRYGLHDKPTGREVATILVKQNVITRLQAERLLEGRYHGFFIDNFKLIEILGSGGMGRLYLAEDTETCEVVAVKVLTEAIKNDPGMLTRLRLEARAGQKLHHPNIVHTRKIDRTQDVFDFPYLVMDFEKGIALHELVSMNGPCKWPFACDIILQAAAGLQHAHEMGLVHRDIKPANLLIKRDGTTMILDFGLALLDDEQEDEFSLAMIFGHDCLGSADFMAPEQSLDSNKVDARADVYSLGSTLYCALTGKLPFPFPSASETLEASRAQPAPKVQEKVPDVPDEVAAILAKLMAKRPEDRFQSAADVCKALEPFAERNPVPFSFKEVLKKRVLDAKRRTLAMRKRLTSTKMSGTTTTRDSQSQKQVDAPAANRETNTQAEGQTDPGPPRKRTDAKDI